MLIKDWMAPNPVTITEDTSMIKAIHLMKERRFRRLPVVAQGKLVGMVTDRDLKEASPSKATTLDVHELYYLLAELQDADPEELEYLGLRDLLAEAALWLIEWPERGAGLLPPPDLTIAIAYLPEGRSLTLSAHGERGQGLLAGLQFRWG